MLSGLHKFMDYYYNRDDYLSFGGESVKVPPLKVLYVLYIKLYCPFPCLSCSQLDLHECFISRNSGFIINLHL